MSFEQMGQSKDTKLRIRRISDNVNDLSDVIHKPMAESPLSHVILDIGQFISTDRLIDFKASINDLALVFHLI